MGVADAGRDDLVVAGQLGVDLLFGISVDRVDRSVEFGAVGLPQVDEVDRFIEGGGELEAA